MVRIHFRQLLTAFALLLATASASADSVNAAVAANFAGAIKQLAPLFKQQTGHELVPSFGATGKLYAQIHNGAPFDVFLAADAITSQKLVDEGQATADSNFIYARGQLALWSSDPGYIDSEGAVLKSEVFERIAIASPKTAPYGQAAVEVMTGMGLWERLGPKLVTGENIAQTQQFVISGNVSLGFIALAQVLGLPEDARGSYWIVPQTLYQPIDQGAVILKRANSPTAAQAFFAFLQSPQAVAVMQSLGYET